MDKKKLNVPKKGAGRRLAERLKEIGQRPPPKGWTDILNETEEPKVEKKKIASPRTSNNDMEA